MESILVCLMFLFLLGSILSGFPVAFALMGTGFVFGMIGIMFGFISFDNFAFLPQRIFGIVENVTLMAVPLFVFMGIILEKSNLSKELLEMMASLMKKWKAGLAVSVILVGTLLAASTGIVGATVVTMGILSLPTMLKHGYSKQFSAGVIASSGTLGQIIPPSIVLIILGDMMNVDVGSLFAGAIFPGVLLVVCYLVYVSFKVYFDEKINVKKEILKEEKKSLKQILNIFIPTGGLVLIVLGSIMAGIASPTESAACGAFGGILIAGYRKKLNKEVLFESAIQTVKMTTMVFTILIGAQVFGLVFRLLSGDEMIVSIINDLNLHRYWVIAFIMMMIFLLGFVLDFLEICFIVIPIIVPIFSSLGFYSEQDLLFFAVLIAINLQSSFLTPPFGFALFYLKASTKNQLSMSDIYKGVVPFIVIQVIVLVILLFFPKIVTWLPTYLSASY